MLKKWMAVLLSVFVLLGSGIARADGDFPAANGNLSQESEEMTGGSETPDGGGTSVDLPTESETKPPFEVNAKSAILMEAKTGRVLAEWNADEALPPASVTKIMTLLLTMEAIGEGKFSLADTVQISEYAASMGGSQVFLEPGESITVEDLVKSVVISSANDGAVALAELVSGDVDSFVVRMNERAAEMGMKNTHFENPTGLDDTVTNHVFSARDIAIASRELITKYPKILEYSCIWMDSIRGGAFGLTNTNRLVRFYRGANGLKTGSTSKAKFCMSATALRDGMQLIAVVMGSDTRDIRNETAKKLLDWGFSNFGVVTFAGNSTDPIPVRGGKAEEVSAEYGEISFLLEKGTAARIKKTVNVAQELDAPIEEGSVVGRVIYDLDGVELGGVDIVAGETVARLGFGDILSRMLKTFFLCEDFPQASSENGEKPEGGETEMLKSMGILDKRCFV